MWYGNNVPGEPGLGGMYPTANDFDIMALASLDGKGGASFYNYFFRREFHRDIFK